MIALKLVLKSFLLVVLFFWMMASIILPFTLDTDTPTWLDIFVLVNTVVVLTLAVAGPQLVAVYPKLKEWL